MVDLHTEIDRFRLWANAFPEGQRGGEWEVAYEAWAQLYTALFEFLDDKPIEEWSSGEMKDVLYAMARDNESQYISRELRCKYPHTIVPLARASLDMGEQDARWQLAEELGHLCQSGGPEEELLRAFADDNDEYVRRRALSSLARISSPATEKLVRAEWNRPDRDQEWARMNVLWCLHKTQSPHLEAFLAEAERDGRQYLTAYARRVRDGDIQE